MKRGTKIIPKKRKREKKLRKLAARELRREAAEVAAEQKSAK